MYAEVKKPSKLHVRHDMKKKDDNKKWRKKNIVNQNADEWFDSQLATLVIRYSDGVWYWKIVTQSCGANFLILPINFVRAKNKWLNSVCGNVCIVFRSVRLFFSDGKLDGYFYNVSSINLFIFAKHQKETELTSDTIVYRVHDPRNLNEMLLNFVKCCFMWSCIYFV